MSKLAKVVLPLVAIGGLGGAAYYLSQHGSAGAHNVMDLARSTPQKAFFWAAAEMREEFGPTMLTDQLERAKKDYPGFSQFCLDFEKETVQKLETVVRTYAASGYLALYLSGDREYIEFPPGPQPPVDVVLDCQLYDPKAAEAMLTKLKETSQKETVAGQTVYVSKRDFCLTLAGDSLLLASNKATMEKAIAAALQHKATLAEDAQFQQAVAKVPYLSRGNGSAIYLDLNPIWNSIEKAPQVGRYTDADTFKSLRSLPYLIGGVSIQGDKWSGGGFLAVNGGNELAKAFLSKPTSAHELAAAVPETWGFFQGFDTYYTYELLQAFVRLAPIGRMGLTIGFSKLGLGPGGETEQKIRKAFTGQSAWSMDLGALAQAGGQGMVDARKMGQTTACRSNLKNLATGLEMYASDNDGRYPISTETLLTGKYFKQIPTCPAAGKDTYSQSYKSRTNPDAFTFRCSDLEAHDLSYDSDQGLLGADSGIAPVQKQENPSEKVRGAFLLGVKDSSLARELIGLTGAWQKVETGGREAFTLTSNGVDLYYLLLDKPAVLAFGFGPKGQESLAALIEAAAGKTPALAGRPNFSGFAAKYSKDSAEISYLNLQAFFQQVESFTSEADKASVKPALDLLRQQLSDDLGSIQVETDGLRYSNEGSAGMVGLAGAFTLPILVPNFIKARGQGMLTACKSNQKNIATALEMYATDYSGAYPADLKPLVTGPYLRLIPTCPAAGKDTYSETYQVRSSPDSFSFYCSGHNHGTLVPAGFPQYNAETGLNDHP